MRRLVGLFCLAAVLAASPAFAKFDPSFVWSTIETPHFIIHFHQDGAELAGKAAAIAEDVHQRLVPRIGWEPRDKTRMVLVDSSDAANGSAFPIPYNWMVIYLTHPLGEPALGLTVYDDFLRALITHEYVHVLQLDMTAGVPSGLQKVLGRIYFPNMFQPLWMIEGLATYEETEQTAGGRGRSPGVDMALRMAVLEDAFPELAQASVTPDFWPAGQVSYYFGESFTRYIAEKYGREKLAEVSKAYSGRGVPFLVTSTGLRVLGERYDDLWDEWVAHLRERYQKQEAAIKARGLTASRALTIRGFLNLAPAWSPDGARIAYAKTDGASFPSLALMNADGSSDRVLVENVFPFGTSGAASSWGPDGQRLYYTKLEIERSVNMYNDLYWFEPASGKEHRLTKGLRARDPHVSPDGGTVVFVTNRMGRTRLGSLAVPQGPGGPLTQKDVTFLTEESGDQYANPRISPDGTKIAVSVWRPGGNMDIRILDSRGAKLGTIADDRAYDHAPAWGPDGKYLFFSSDRTGVFNIYAYNAETSEILQVTNVVGGATHPAPSPDGKTLAFASYGARGFDLHTMALDPRAWKPAQAFVDPYPAPRYEDRQVETSPARPYSAFSTVYPRFWLPWIGSSPESGLMLGALTMGWDVLQLHRYTAAAFYGPKHSRKWYSLDYFYDGFYPTLGAHASDTDATYSDLLVDAQGEKDYVERQRSAGLSVTVPFVKTARQQSVTLGYERMEMDGLTTLPPWQNYAGVTPPEGTLASGRLLWRFNSSRRYLRSISPEQGRTVEAGYERFDKSLGSDFEFNKYAVDWFEFVNLPFSRQVLMVRAFAAASTGEALPQGAFQLGGDSPGDVTLSLADRAVHLRGYPVNALRGERAALGSLEYRFPLADLQRGWNTKAVYFRNFHGALFAEAGSAWNGAFHRDGLRKSVGGELRSDLYVAYYVPVTFRFVVAKGLDEDGETTSYLGLWVPLEL